jgi:hypothetical protein
MLRKLCPLFTCLLLATACSESSNQTGKAPVDTTRQVTPVAGARPTLPAAKPLSFGDFVRNLPQLTLPVTDDAFEHFPGNTNLIDSSLVMKLGLLAPDDADDYNPGFLKHWYIGRTRDTANFYTVLYGADADGQETKVYVATFSKAGNLIDQTIFLEECGICTFEEMLFKSQLDAGGRITVQKSRTETNEAGVIVANSNTRHTYQIQPDGKIRTL